MMKEYGFFVRYGDAFYSSAFDKLNEARADARSKSPNEKLKIYHGELVRKNDQIIDESGLSIVPRLGGYEERCIDKITGDLKLL